MRARDFIDRVIDRSGIGRFALNRGRSRLRILCYHGVWAAPGPHFGDKLFMSAAKFEARLSLIRKLGLEVMPMREAVSALRDGRLPPRAAAITIDDGWATTFSHMLPALERNGFPATVYVQTQRIDAGAPVADVALRYAIQNTGEREVSLDGLPHAASPSAAIPLTDNHSRASAFRAIIPLFDSAPVESHRSLLGELYARLRIDMRPLAEHRAFDLGSAMELVEADRKGFEIALHTHTHDLGDLSRTAVRDEIAQNRASLSRVLGRSPESFQHFCWPSGEYTRSAIEHLRSTGIDLATSCDADLADQSSDFLALPRILDGQTMSDEAFLVAISGIHRWKGDRT